MADFSTEHAACRQPFFEFKSKRRSALRPGAGYAGYLPITSTESDMQHSYLTDDEHLGGVGSHGACASGDYQGSDMGIQDAIVTPSAWL